MHSQLRCTAGAVLVVVSTFACTEPDQPPTHLAFVDQPITATRAEPLATIKVEARNAAGQRVTDWQGAVTITAVDTVSILSGSRTVTAVEGVATFSDLRVDVVIQELRLRASAAGLSNAISLPFEVKHGRATKLAFSRNPSSVRADGVITPAIVVHIQDAAGYLATSSNDAVTLSLADNPAGATMSGSLTEAAVNGVATFASVTIDRAGQGYTLRATAPGLSETVSSGFNVRGAFSAVTAGYFHSCALASDGTYCWGDVGVTPTFVPTTVTFSAISSGRDLRCGLTSAGAAHCWTGSEAPSAVPGGIAFGSLAAGYQHSCGVNTAGVGYCWGYNQSGELGNGSVGGQSNSPLAVAGGHTFAQISAGRIFSCGVTTNKVAYCWGDNTSGNLGTGVEAGSAIPAAVSEGMDFVAVGAGGFHACGLKSDGAAWCWGSNGSGQLGDGSTTNRTTPVVVAGGLRFATLSVGNRHTCGITAVGVAYCWGDNIDGMLGRGAPGNSSMPVAVAGGLTFTSIRAGRFHTCGAATDDETYCWGSNNSGLLGNGTGTSSFTPVRVP